MPPSDLDRAIAQVAQSFSGRISLYAEHMETHEVIRFQPSLLMETASVIKLPVLAATMQQIEERHLDLAMDLVLQEEDFVEGSGVVQNLTPGLSLSLHDALMLMITVSDNTATNMVLRLVGLDTVNAAMQAWSFPHIQIFKRIDFAVPGPIGLARADELSALLKRLHDRTLVSPWACDVMWDILTRQQYNTLMTRDLPYALLAEESGQPAPVQIGSKSGSLEGIRNDVGIVQSPWGDYTVALLSDGCHDLRFHIDNEAQRILPRLTRLVFDHFISPDHWA